MRRVTVVFSSIALIACAVSGARAQNLTANSSFESPVVTSGDGAIGVWFAFNGGGGALSENSTLDPRTGAQSLRLVIPGLNNNFAGAFQDIPGLTPGQQVTYSAWHKSAGTFDIGAELRIEWRNPGNTAEVSRTANFVPTLTGNYAQYSLNSTVPAGVGVARIVYAIQSFGDGGTNTGTAFVDDVSFTAVPEPSSLAMIALCGLGLGAASRRRA